MIKVLMQRKDNRPPAVLFGLSGENVTRLVAGEPISLNLSEMGLPDTPIVIMYGTTEDAIVTELRDKWQLKFP